MKKHKHLFKKISDEVLMLNDNPFSLPDDIMEGLEPTPTRVVKFICKCGETQEFHVAVVESLPDEFSIRGGI